MKKTEQWVTDLQRLLKNVKNGKRKIEVSVSMILMSLKNSKLQLLRSLPRVIILLILLHNLKVVKGHPKAKWQGNCLRRKKRKAELSDLLATEMRDVRVALQDIAGAIKTTNRRIRSEEEIVEELIRLGFGGDYLMEGTEFLVADPIRANTFFAFPEEVRRDWLLRKLAC
ncbi:unnamed protein product [Linum trigynum]|uniref:Uncharacterized protein n=1 Tax=Linum trigynum TaxID=586398 RepID=A0AAV2FJV6_9ROSI